MSEIERKVKEARAGGDPTGWFEPLYAAASAGEGSVPWDRGAPRALLVEWAESRRPQGRTALVVGCGLGFDAEYVSGLGFATVAFDVSATATRRSTWSSTAWSAPPGSAARCTTSR